MKKTIGYGLFIWILMFVIVSIFVAFNLKDALWVKLATAVIGGVIAFVLAGKITLATYGSALSFGLVWAIIGLVLDYLVSRKFEPAIFSMWTYWLGYALVVLAPLLRVKRLPRM